MTKQKMHFSVSVDRQMNKQTQTESKTDNNRPPSRAEWRSIERELKVVS